MSATHFRVIYDGPAVADGEMDVSQLASSLLALGKLIEAADALVKGEPGRVRVRVSADVARGSFDVGIAVSFLESAFTWIQTPSGAGTLALIGLLGFNIKDGAVGLIQAVRWLRGRAVVRRITLADGRTSIEVESGDTLDVPDQVARMVDEYTVRQSLERFTEPLRDDGVTEIRFEPTKGVVSERIVEGDAHSFEAQADSAPTSVSRYEATFQIKRLYFERGKKWRLSNGAQTIMAPIEDEVFWSSVESGNAAFSSADYLVCLVRMDQWLGSAGLKTEYAIEEVKRHIPAPKQARMDI